MSIRAELSARQYLHVPPHYVVQSLQGCARPSNQNRSGSVYTATYAPLGVKSNGLQADKWNPGQAPAKSTQTPNWANCLPAVLHNKMQNPRISVDVSFVILIVQGVRERWKTGGVAMQREGKCKCARDTHQNPAAVHETWDVWARCQRVSKILCCIQI